MAGTARGQGSDERVVLRMRSHLKALTRPALALIGLGGLLGVGTGLIPSAERPAGQYVVEVVVAGLAVWWSGVPFLRWRRRTYILTDQRLLTREGVLTRTGYTLPLSRVHDVTYRRSLGDRVLGCGTLHVQTVAEGALVIDDVPDVELVHRTLSGLLRQDRAWPPPAGPADRVAGDAALTARPGARWPDPPAAPRYR